MTWNQQWPKNVRYLNQGINTPAAAQQANMGGMQAPSMAGMQSPSTAAMQPAPSTAEQEGGSFQQPPMQTPGQTRDSDVQHPPASVPSTDIIETQSEIVVRVDAPGFEKDQLHIHAAENRLYVTGDRSEDVTFDSSGGERPLAAERPLRIERTIPLSVHIDPEKATATHENGVCEVVIPKGETESRSEIAFQ